MRALPVSATRSVKIKDLKPEFRKLIPADHKGDDYQFSTSGEADFPGDLDEAIEKHGKATVYETFLRQAKTDHQNEMAAKILEKVLDPSKSKRGSGAAVQIKL